MIGLPVQAIRPEEVMPRDTDFFTVSWQILCQQMQTIVDTWMNDVDIEEDEFYPLVRIVPLINAFLADHCPATRMVILPFPKKTTMVLEGNLVEHYRQAGWQVYYLRPDKMSPDYHYEFFVLKLPA